MSVAAPQFGENHEPAEAFVVTGARQPKLCPECFLEHNGECP
jgi:hypothetical protein